MPRPLQAGAFNGNHPRVAASRFDPSTRSVDAAPDERTLRPMTTPKDDHVESDLMRQVKDALDDRRRQPTKELGIPDHREDTEGESDKRDGDWKHQRDGVARQKRRSERA